MVKGISRQVIVLQSPQAAMFEQAIFILKDGTPAFTDSQLLKEANRMLDDTLTMKNTGWGKVLYAFGGALVTGIAWLLTVFM